MTRSPSLIIASAFLAMLALLLPALAQHPATATSPASAPSPAAAAALYQQILHQYVTSDWEALLADLPNRTRDIAAMSKDQQADIAYIRQALADGRPAWWNTVKQGTKTQITTRLWQRPLTATYDPTVNGVQLKSTNGQIALSLNWAAADMDSPALAEHGFTKGDLAYVGIWQDLSTAQNFGNMSALMTSALSEQDRTRLNRFMAFRATLTAAYYGTPRARRWAAFLSFDAYLDSHLAAEGFIPRKPVGAMIIAEVIAHPEKYPSLRIPKNINPANPESALAASFMNQFERTMLPFPEDKSLREALKDFAATANATPVYTTGKVTLPNKLLIPLNPAEDADPAAKRNAWLLDHLPK